MSGKKVVALCGGVGGAKLALGLSQVLPPSDLLIIANTGDDFVHLGLPISPDLDTVMYTLAGISNKELGWGLQDETWNTMTMISEYGGEDWFRLGDRDIATHLMRKQLLQQGLSLSEVTRYLTRHLGVAHRLLPMSDDNVRTLVETEGELMPFQHYFVKNQCNPRVSAFEFAGAATAAPQQELMSWLNHEELSSVVICPSNPFVSITPMLSIPAIKEALRDCKAPVLAVSPIIGGRAIKGPAAKMMTELGIEVTATAVADFYRGLVDGMIIDNQDASQTSTIEGLGMKVLSTQTLMKTLDDKVDLAQKVLEFSEQFEA